MSKLKFFGKIRDSWSNDPTDKFVTVKPKTKQDNKATFSSIKKRFYTFDTRNFNNTTELMDTFRNLNKGLAQFSKLGVNGGYETREFFYFPLPLFNDLEKLKNSYCSYTDHLLITVNGVMTISPVRAEKQSEDNQYYRDIEPVVDARTLLEKDVNYMTFRSVKEIEDLKCISYDLSKTLAIGDCRTSGKFFEVYDDVDNKVKLSDLPEERQNYAIARSDVERFVKVKDDKFNVSFNTRSIELKREFVDPNNYKFQLGIQVNGYITLADNDVNVRELLFEKDGVKFYRAKVKSELSTEYLFKNINTLTPFDIIYSDLDMDIINPLNKKFNCLDLSYHKFIAFDRIYTSEKQGTGVTENQIVNVTRYNMGIMTLNTYNEMFKRDGLFPETENKAQTTYITDDLLSSILG